MLTDHEALQQLCINGVICNIGQISKQVARKLDKWAKRPENKIVKFRGHWFPVAGCPEGIGPLKTCWAFQGHYDWLTSTQGGIAAARAEWDQLVTWDRLAREQRAVK